MNELYLYDRDEGLFKSILKYSNVIEGRYYILASGNEINTSNIGQYISDALNGMQSVAQKYPVCLCMPPRSVGGLYSFTLFFLTKSGTTGQNKIKEVDIDTQVSTHHTWYDWKDMTQCAEEFMDVLNKIIRLRSVDGIALRSMMTLLPEGRDLTRLSNLGNDNLSGVRISFRMQIRAECETQDYADPGSIAIPSLNIHPLHKH